MSLAKLGSQRGAALVIGMLFTIVLTVLGVAAIQSSSTGIRMARNAEARINGFQQAQAASDYVAAEALNLNLDDMGSSARCTASYPSKYNKSCGSQALPSLPSPLLTPPVHIRVRTAVAFGSSMGSESNKVFERVIESDYDGTTSSTASDATHVGVISAVRGTIVSTGTVHYERDVAEPTPSPAPTATPSGDDGHDGEHEGEYDDGHDGEHEGEHEGEYDDGQEGEDGSDA
ncbi:MAG: PilX N-terminal domain-containing pilus assembly protein [Methylococcus sp.]|nr:PilX N-terminal domain-containing pilus assembly protein [Methylococcus sp.]